MQASIAKLDPTRPPQRWLLRLPGVLYSANLGWMLGQRFVQLTVRGRKTGLLRRVVLEVIGHDASGSGLLVASAWGRRAQWFRNLQVNPHAQARVGRRQFAAEVSILDEDAAAGALREYARIHPWAYRWFIGPLLLGRRATGTSDELANLARVVPVLLISAAA
jgi:deazaflavin-dependent oxidoreductase (nitroreductase family)